MIKSRKVPGGTLKYLGSEDVRPPEWVTFSLGFTWEWVWWDHIYITFTSLQSAQICLAVHSSCVGKWTFKRVRFLTWTLQLILLVFLLYPAIWLVLKSQYKSSFAFLIGAFRLPCAQTRHFQFSKFWEWRWRWNCVSSAPVARISVVG